MAKYDKITKGMSIVDIDETGLTYNYYGYVRNNSEYVILRMNKAETEYRYKLGASGYSGAWADKANLTYKLPTIG